MCEELLDHYEEEENYEEVVRLIDEIILKNPEKASSLLFRKANALIELEKYSQAITTLNIYVKICSKENQVISYVTIARCYIALKNQEKTFEYLEKALELGPDEEILIKELSYFAFVKSEYEKCYVYVEKLIELEKADIEDYTNLIFCCLQLDKIDEALEYAEKIIELDPTNLDVFATLTILYDNLEDKDKLTEVCERIISLDDDGTTQIIILKAQALVELGKNKEAFEHVNRAIKLNPYDPFPYLMKGLLFNKLEMFEEAKECFNEAFTLDPDLLLSFEKYR